MSIYVNTHIPDLYHALTETSSEKLRTRESLLLLPFWSQLLHVLSTPTHAPFPGEQRPGGQPLWTPSPRMCLFTQSLSLSLSLCQLWCCTTLLRDPDSPVAREPILLQFDSTRIGQSRRKAVELPRRFQQHCRWRLLPP